MITMDGVMQAPGGPDEDRSGGFKYGGWTFSYSDDLLGKVTREELKSSDYLLGRKHSTFLQLTGLLMLIFGPPSMKE